MAFAALVIVLAVIVFAGLKAKGRQFIDRLNQYLDSL